MSSNALFKLPRIAVVGAGISGLVLARTLQHFKIPCSILDYKPINDESTASKYKGIGIWNHAQQCLKNLEIINDDTRSQFLFIPPASYRDINGRWLSSASNTKFNNNRVATIRQNNLLKLLQDGIDPNLVSYQNNAKLYHLHPNGKNQICASFIESSDGNAVNLDELNDIDLLIAADGQKSAVRQMLYPSMKESYQPYIIISGIANCTRSNYAFEILHNKHRFAYVPLPNKEFFWFTHYRKDDKMNYDANGDKDELERAMNLSETYLKRFCAINLTDTFCLKDECKVLFDGNNIDQLMPMKRIDDRYNIGFIGDSVHAMPNNLAQTGAIGIEDGYELGISIANNRGDLRKALMEYDNKRRLRVKQCQQVTTFTEYLSAQDGVYEKIRNNLLYHTPNFLNTRIFDLFLNHSMNQKQYQVSPMKSTT